MLSNTIHIVQECVFYVFRKIKKSDFFSLLDFLDLSLWLSVIFRPKTLGLQYMLLLLHFYVLRFFLKIQNNVTFYVFLLCFTRVLELWQIHTSMLCARIMHFTKQENSLAYVTMY